MRALFGAAVPQSPAARKAKLPSPETGAEMRGFMRCESAMSALRSAKNYEASGDIVAALGIYRDLYARNPADEDAIMGIAGCALSLDALETALEFSIRLLILNRGNPWGYYGRAAVMFRCGMGEKALADAMAAIECDVPPSPLRIDIAALLNAYGCHDIALCALDPIKSAFIGIDMPTADARDFMIEYAAARLALAQTDDPDLRRIIGLFETMRGEDGAFDLCVAAYRCRCQSATRADYDACAAKYPDLAELSEILVSAPGVCIPSDNR